MLQTNKHGTNNSTEDIKHTAELCSFELIRKFVMLLIRRLRKIALQLFFSGKYELDLIGFFFIVEKVIKYSNYVYNFDGV